ncbi:bifunctional metallophosphatase/5'-nucleotidase [Anaeromyxobacter terrae]|uniref:bifunctional metallophosphatase/5'-nucleotidase n=1 Tax=Anaeromyxobacter terrae TaxID=2925406 RepID=UPI001F56863E|nr:5'-nucleotidase C-terminal domain-containing protein [Anaeromyxobacter sp. SG22]
MKRLLRRTVLALTAIALLVGPVLASDTTVTILSVDDTHANLHAGGPKDANLDGTLGGIAKAVTVVAQERAANPGALFLHAGDSFFGDAYFGATLGAIELQLLKAAGVDAMALGNHEFWIGVDGLLFGYATAFPGGVGGFPLLCANLARPVPFVSAHTMLQAGDVNVGVFGLMTPHDAITNEQTDFIVTGGELSELSEIAAGEVSQLRSEGAKVVILLSHLGIELDRFIADNVTGIDAIMGGHDHYVLAETWNGVPIVHAGAYYRHVGKVTLSVGDTETTALSREVIAVDDSIPAAPSLAAAVRGWQAWIQQTYGNALGPDFFWDPIAYATEDVTNEINFRSTRRDTGTGNLVTDAMRWRTGTDLAFTVNGQTPQGLFAGPIVADDLYRVVALGIDPSKPILGWPLVKFSLTGEQVLAALEATIHVSLSDDDFIAQVSGMKYTYDSSRDAGERVLSARIGHEGLDPSAEYSVTTNALLFRSLGEMFGIEPKDPEFLNDYEYWVLRDYVTMLGNVEYKGESRVKDIAPGYARH